MSDESNEQKVHRYTENLKSGVDVKRALKRLVDLDVPAKVFQEIETRKYVKRYLEDSAFSKYANRLRQKLKNQEKEMAAERKRKQSQSELSDVEMKPQVKKVKQELSTDQLFAMAMSGDQSTIKEGPSKPVDYSKYKVSKKKDIKKEPDVEVKNEPASSSSNESYNTLEQARVQLNKEYMPSVRPSMPSAPSRPQPALSNSTGADERMFKPRKERQKVFAGRRKKAVGEVQPLLVLCQNVLAVNINMIGCVGWAPYHLLKSTLLRCNVEQLRRIIDMNPNLAEEADELFHDMIKREFPKYADRDVGESSYRDLYDRLVLKRDRKEKDKLEMLTNRIGKSSGNQDTGRRTMVIEAAHTQQRRRFPSLIPTSHMKATPSAIELSQARKNVKTQGRAQLNTLQGPIRSAPSSTGRGAPEKKKTAPLMAKVKKMLRR